MVFFIKSVFNMSLISHSYYIIYQFVKTKCNQQFALRGYLHKIGVSKWTTSLVQLPALSRVASLLPSHAVDQAAAFGGQSPFRTVLSVGIPCVPVLGKISSVKTTNRNLGESLPFSDTFHIKTVHKKYMLFYPFTIVTYFKSYASVSLQQVGLCVQDLNHVMTSCLHVVFLP